MTVCRPVLESLSQSKSEADVLRERIGGLESVMAVTQRELEAARSRIKELEEAAAKARTEEKPSEPVSFTIEKNL